MRENFVQPLKIGFQANQEKQGRKKEREIQHEATSHGIAKSSHVMPNSKGQQLQDKFRALPGAIVYILYIFSKLGKSGVQRFKWCANRS